MAGEQLTDTGVADQRLDLVDPTLVMEQFEAGGLDNEAFIYANGLRTVYGEPDFENAARSLERFRSLTPGQRVLVWHGAVESPDWYTAIPWVAGVVGDGPVSIEPPLNDHWRKYLTPVVHIPTATEGQELVVQWDSPTHTILLGQDEIGQPVTDWLDRVRDQLESLRQADHKKRILGFVAVLEELAMPEFDDRLWVIKEWINLWPSNE